jgi:hypothetical protein
VAYRHGTGRSPVRGGTARGGATPVAGAWKQAENFLLPAGTGRGSVGRSKDFDGAFLPVRRNVEERWKRVDRAFHLGVDLPP